MPRVLVTAEVNDLRAWENGFRAHGDLFKQMGVSIMEATPRSSCTRTHRSRMPQLRASV